MSNDSRGTPTEEELRDTLNQLADFAGDLASGHEDDPESAEAARDYRADEHRLRWLSEHVSGLLEDRARLDWLEDAVPSGKSRDTLATLPAIWPGSVRALIDAARRALDSTA